MEITGLDRKIIAATQAGLPLTMHPYRSVAEQLGVSAELVMRRISAMLEAGVIRRIGAVPNHYRLGYRCNGMTVWDIDDDRVDDMGERVGRLSFVSHCYRRPRHPPDWPFNLFAMVHARTEAQAVAQIQQIARVLGACSRGHEVLYSSRMLKKTGLRIG